MIDLKQNVQYVKGVGPARVTLLNSLGIYTLEDLLTYFPREYEDRSKQKKIGDLIDGEEVTIEARVVSEINIGSLTLNSKKNLVSIKNA